MSEPLVTVYIPTYNRVDLLERAVDSVRNQTYQNLEIIIVDDCSTDSTHDYLEAISKSDSRIRYFLKEKNSGACISRNIAIENARGEFITGLDDDDYFFNNRIEYFVKEYLLQEDEVIALYTPTVSHSLKQNFSYTLKHLLSVKKVSQRDLLFANYVGNQIFTKKEVLIQAGLFDPEFRAWQDFDLWYRVAKIGKIKRLMKPTYYFDRNHGGVRITTENINKIMSVRDMFKEKHNIKNKIDELALDNHLFNYDTNLVKFSNVMVRFLFQFKDLKNNMYYLYRYIKTKI